MKKYTILFAASFLLASTACKNDDPVAPGKDTDGGVIFEDIFGRPFGAHTWTSCWRGSVTVVSDNVVQHIGVYGRLGDCRWLLTQTDGNSPSGIVQFYYVEGMDIEVVVDGKVYASQVGATVHASGHSSTPPAWVSGAPRLGWVMAAELDEFPDYDFNDVVARLEQAEDGGVKVQALCAGKIGPIWLHYTNGSDDYVLGPECPNGNYMRTEFLDEINANSYAWNTWFSNGTKKLSVSWLINAAITTGANGFTGATITLPREILSADFSPEYYCISTVNNGKPEIVSGFYITVGAYDASRRPALGDKYSDTVMAMVGEAPRMLLLPDVTQDDTPEKIVGWQWPTEDSRIDKVYSLFLEWVKDPTVCWSVTAPDGWPWRGAQQDDKGNFIYWGYYPRVY